MSLKWIQLSDFFGYTACTWSFVFGIAHIYWAVGGTIGLLGHSMTGVLFLINLIAIPLCFLAAVVALASTKSWNHIAQSWIWRLAAWGACGLLAARGLIGLTQSVISSEPIPLLLVAYDSWFLLGGILFGMVAILNDRR